ncbi:MAG TPA: asparagine synthase-related protein [Gemmatimonadales bacterium]
MIAILGTAAAPDETLARAMLAAAPHRGSCVTLRVLGNCVLGVAHRPGAPDSTLSGEGPIIAALAGRLDNAAELHAALIGAGVPPASPGDADVVVAAFRAFGPDAPCRMRGCFAGIVTDGHAVWCFRDHVGFRPLFYRHDPAALVVASESRQVIVGARLPEEPDLDVLTLMFYGHMPADTPAALKGVARLPQGSTLTLDRDHRLTVRRYWHPEVLLESARLTAADVGDRFAQLLDQAVARTLTGRDVILLSGGLDSPAVAAFAAPEHRRRTGRPIGALSAVFPDLPSVDERAYIELIAQHFGIELHTHRPSARALDDVDHWCRLFGTPVPIVSVPELAASHSLARRLGYENILTGDFAEFAFGSPMHVVSHLLTHGRWRALGGLLVAERRRGASWRRLAQHVLATFVPGRLANWYLHVRRLDAPHRIPAWLDARKVNQVPFRADLLPPARLRWLRVQRAGLEGSTITLEADEVCAARAEVTVRRPFADVDLWEFFLSLPAELKCPDLRFKSLVRGMLRGRLPDPILDRRRKTLFDDHVMAQVDYPALRRLLTEPRHPMPGVDYRRLAGRLEREDFNRFDWHWAKDLAAIHAFLNAW